ncbi:hypothetical protein BKA67DRAFT_573328 [Truncatella angustata]|uniref:Uncharacterized protein n=1 Tax=Truncatella angustata TaxID=152316 RepID=A0A9P8ZVP5_9PEZI|nr:uncharacterized protein BKA67DRAFT_573328 [Truncatella angustata]KAH6652215.1 hypothetical protein BKA67DRAFT_573328 [Truncatella angustata]
MKRGGTKCRGSELTENSSGSIITGETGLAHTRTIVDDEGSNLLFHFGGLRSRRNVKKKKRRNAVGRR